MPQHPDPFFFKSAGYDLFGMYHAAERMAATGTCVLLCGTSGTETVMAHRVLRVLASQLARAGFPVLRFDYPGCGDSAGTESDTTTELCVESVLAAATQLRHRSGCTRVAAIGLRKGATIVADSSTQAANLFSHHVFWDPALVGNGSFSSLRLPGSTLVVDSNGEVASALRDLEPSHAFRTAKFLANEGNPWNITSSEEGVFVPGGLIAGIVKHGARHW